MKFEEGSMRKGSVDVVKLPLERLVSQCLLLLALIPISAVSFYMVMTKSPLHLVFDALEPAGPGSVYVQGGGFSGFWYQLGLMQAIPNLMDYEYYCYSSGCLGLVVAFMQISLQEGFQTAARSKDAWLEGRISRYEIVGHFMDDLLYNSTNAVDVAVLDRLNVLVTTSEKGVVSRKAATLEGLKDIITKTMYIPLVTGSSLWPIDSNGTMHADGGFSRALHPSCEYEITVPFTPNTLLHLFNPNFGFSVAKQFWLDGQRQDHPLLLPSASIK